MYGHPIVYSIYTKRCTSCAVNVCRGSILKNDRRKIDCRVLSFLRTRCLDNKNTTEQKKKHNKTMLGHGSDNKLILDKFLVTTFVIIIFYVCTRCMYNEPVQSMKIKWDCKLLYRSQIELIDFRTIRAC